MLNKRLNITMECFKYKVDKDENLQLVFHIN